MEKPKINTGLLVAAVKIGPKLTKAVTILIKSMKATKVALAAGSMVAYSYLYGWRFGVAIMIMLFVHESGHVWAMRRKGIPTKGFYFIPFWGGAAVPERAFHNRSEEYYVAIMGPIWGFLLSLIAMGAYYYTLNPLFGVIASWCALINLLNLLPVNPLDGGRMLKSIAFSISSRVGMAVLVAGMVAGVVLLIWQKIFIFALLLPMGLFELFTEYKKVKNQEEPLPIMQKATIINSTIWYVIIGFSLYFVMHIMNAIPGAELANQVLHDAGFKLLTKRAAVLPAAFSY